MSETIYVHLLDEEIDVWRPVPARRVQDNVYVVEGEDIYDPATEEWEFRPGSRVIVEPQTKQGDFNRPSTVLVAVRLSY